ncbi:MAG: ATP-dependent Clp protease ATP-binding subunit [Candidatus Margulisbacteria bacterium]|nr:ATP-dependent Clp protease ATP-binding subunit [Candidatus Margulisiibacteriota bacterium]
MFSRFTEKAIQSIMLAQEEAKRFRHGYVGTEHILLGIIGEGDNVVLKTMQELGFSLEQIRSNIEERLEYGSSTTEYGNIPFTQQAKQILTSAWDEARKLGHNYVNVEHLFLSIFRDPTSVAARVLGEMGINITNFKNSLFSLLGNRVTTKEQVKQQVPTPTLDLFGRDLTWLAREDKLDPVIGREKEIERIIQILSRRTKNNPVLTGAAGVGKTAIVEGLAQKIIKQDIPEKLLNKRVITLDLGLLVAGTKYRGEFEDRVKKIMEEVLKAGNVMLFVDELHTIIGTGGSEGSLDAANLFKPALARGELQCIGATTLDEYRKHIEGDSALERRFQSVLIDEPPPEEALEILKGIRARYEDFHKVTITDGALNEAVDLSIRYIADRHLPDKAVDLIDEAASRVMLKASNKSTQIKEMGKEQELLKLELVAAKKDHDEGAIKTLEKKEKSLETKLKKLQASESIERVVDETTIADIVSAWTGIPIKKLTEEESQRLIHMQAEMEERVVGQSEAIVALSRAIKRAKVGLKDPSKPMGSFLFLGPSGVGKTETARTLAEFVFGSKDAIVRVDMSEYMERHTVSRLIGSPPGYVGFNEGGQLTEPVRRKPYSIVLFDELEKASPDVINILLQILDEGRLTDATGRKVNFKNTIIIMTSNVGAQFIEKKTSYGFTHSENVESSEYDVMREKLLDELRKEFKPEFLNRIDDIVIFRSLNKKDIRSIVDIMLGDILARLKSKNMHIKTDNKVKEFLVNKGFDPKHGARPLRRAIQEHFEDKLADAMLLSGLKEDIDVKASVKKGMINFVVKPLKEVSLNTISKEKRKARKTTPPMSKPKNVALTA